MFRRRDGGKGTLLTALSVVLLLEPAAEDVLALPIAGWLALLAECELELIAFVADCALFAVVDEEARSPLEA